jgi:hypothetical protein
MAIEQTGTRRLASRGGASVTLAALFFLFFNREASHAFELRAWPLAEIERHGEEIHARFLGPLIEWQRSGDDRFFAIRPLFAFSRSAAETSRGELLYPLATWQRSVDETSVRFLGLGSYVRRASPPAERPYARELTIFPLVFYHSGPAVETSLSFVPLYADLENFFGYERVQMLLFPLFLKLYEPLYEKTWLPFPLLSRVGGRAGTGFRVWPLWGHTALGADYESRYVAWPFYIRAVEHPGREGQVTTRISWPFFSSIDGPRLQSRSYGFLLIFPLYTETVDLKSDTETTGFPWPFWTVERDRKTGERLTLRLTPFYQYRRTATMESVFYLWPFYRRHTGLGEDASYRRTDSMFVIYRDQYEGEGATTRHIRALVPFWVSRSDRDNGDAQGLALLDGLFPTNEALARLYAPLYRLYGRRSRDGATEHDILWRMWSWGDGKLRPPWYWSLD